MKILVTGGAGFIGSHTVDELLRRGHTVRVLDGLLPPVHAAETVPLYVPADVEFIHGDVRDRGAWERALPGVEAVFHLAAYQDYLTDFSRFFHTNAVGTALLYEVAVRDHLPLRKVVVASSQAVYGEGRYHCRAHGGDLPAVEYPSARPDAQLRRGIWEIPCPRCGAPMEPQWTGEERVNPQNQYAVSKYAQEMLALSLGRRYEIPTVCLRYSIVQGARQSFRNAYSGVLRIFTQRVLHGKAPACYEDGRQLRDYVSVHDVVAANLLVLERGAADYEVFNVGGNRHVSVLDYARLVADRAGVSTDPVIPGLYRYGDTRHAFSDVSRLEHLGWHPAVPLQAVVDEYLAWASAQPGFADYTGEAHAQMVGLGAVRAITA